MTRLRHRKGNEYGYTMAELLLVVAILTILLCLSVVLILNYRKKLRQKELDAKAEIIYVAVQNRMSKMKANGNTGIFQYDDGFSNNGVRRIEGIPSDAAEEDSVKEGDLCYFTSAEFSITNTAANVVMDADTVDDTLRQNHWVVEYNPVSAVVYAVFYSENKADCASEYISTYDKYDFNLRYKNHRLNDGARVGYYGGGSASASSLTTLVPQVNVTNGEKLVADLSCSLPSSISQYPVFKVELEDTMGNKYTKYYTYGQYSVEENQEKYEVDYRSLNREGRMFKLSLVLDDLSSQAKRFDNLYGSGSKHNSDAYGKNTGEELVAGTALTITLTVSCPGNYLITQNQSKTVITNSLFADDTLVDETGNMTAMIMYGRHLQNLDASSGVTENVKAAVQASDIIFQDNVNLQGLYNWKETYKGQYFNGMVGEDANFKSIENDNLISYCGANDQESYRISGLVESQTENGGLFAFFGSDQTKSTLSDIILTGSKIQALENAGALVGRILGDTDVTHCQYFLTADDLKEKDNKNIWISGKNVGGLIGSIEKGHMFMEKSGASSVLGSKENTDYVGGLVGYINEGDLSIMASYADSYLSGKIGSGLVGLSKTETRITSCYAAGFLTAVEEGAGFLCGSATMNDSYTILSRYDMLEAIYHSTAKDGVSNNNVYFIADANNEGVTVKKTHAIGVMTSKQMAEKLNTSMALFSLDTATSLAYNLMDQGLSTYTYPALKELNHYGDWTAEFQVGALVYYEAYEDGSYGFYGANVESTLKNDVDVIGDGYGLVYPMEEENLPSKIRVQIMDDNEEIDSQDIDIDGKNCLKMDKEYAIYPLDKDLANLEYVSDSYYVKAIVSAESSQIQNDYYYFNPHFAKTVIYLQDPEAKVPALNQESKIAIRTPRHLYNLSLFHDDGYVDVTSQCEYIQERNVDYKTYDWENYTAKTSVKSQRPIGLEKAFRANYNGQCHWIRNISFVTENGNYVGLFGLNAGSIKNVVLRADYNTDGKNNYYVRRKSDIRACNVYMGILAGMNMGSISNCAVAGYYLAGSDATIHAYENSRLSIGGLVGSNGGSIQTSTADCPNIRLSSTFANVYLGGFAGQNTGSIQNCYDLGYLDVAYSRGGKVEVAGFAAKNSGLIQTSYCATAIDASGETATTYGFAPKGGTINGKCYYLNNGTYSYVKQLFSFQFDQGVGIGATYDELEEIAKNNKAEKSYNFTNTITEDKVYPFRAVVRNAKGQRVHYGDWMDDQEIGMTGIFYWEKEEGGSNNGYHFTCLGRKGDSQIGLSSLCNSHDDGGRITEYGYGYFEENEGSIQEVTMSDMTWSGKSNYNKTVSKELGKQMSGYHFYPFTTKTEKDGDYIFLNGEGRDSSWTIKYQNAGSVRTDQYVVSPYFANAMQSKNGDSLSITGRDDKTTEYGVQPGLGNDNPYEIRSLQQLQFINWNHSNQNTSTEVTANTYKKFTYLQYATVTGKGSQTRENAEQNRPYLYFRQSHDLEQMEQNQSFTPIAAAGTTSVDNYEAILYAWFGNDYDGESYIIKNVSIQSKCYSVGLFGVTAGAKMEDVIMYSDQESVIQRNTENHNDHIGAYALGGLIGVAFDYYKNGSISKQNPIRNCVIAGYKLVDNSKSKQGLGEANVGGLIGVANVDLQQCSAVTDIEINCTHEHPFAKWGNFIRVGGLTGAAQGVITNCYSGGNISVGAETLKETYNSNLKNINGLNELANFSTSTHIYLGGIAGSAFTSNYKNFTNVTSTNEGTPKFYNCYTYVNFPTWEGTIRGITLIAGYADCYNFGNGVTISNCYYLGQIANIDYQCPKYYFTNKNWNDLSESTRNTYLDSILHGSCKYLKYMMNGSVGSDRCSGKPIGVTHEQMSDQNSQDTLTVTDASGKVWSTFRDALNQGNSSDDLNDSKYHWVTVTEGSNQVSIPGKYSFPAGNKALEGKNYPFPTIITQPDLTFGGKIQVHYGEWPVGGPVFDQGRTSMDIFVSMEEDGYAKQTYYLLDSKETTQGHLTKDAFISDNPDIAEVIDCSWEDADKRYAVTVLAHNIGSTTISASGISAQFTLEITADIQLQAQTATDPFQLGEMESAEIELSAVTDLQSVDQGNHFETKDETTWTIKSDYEALVELKQKNTTTSKNIWSVTRLGNGNVILEIGFSYDYQGVILEAKTFLNLLQPDAVGLSDGHTYNASDLTQDGENEGHNTQYTIDIPVREDMENGSYFLYLKSEEMDISEMSIENVTIEAGNVVESYSEPSSENEDCRIYDAGDDAIFHVEMNKTVDKDENYQYICGKISHKSTEAIQNVTLSITLENVASYFLTIQMDEIPGGEVETESEEKKQDSEKTLDEDQDPVEKPVDLEKNYKIHFEENLEEKYQVSNMPVEIICDEKKKLGSQISKLSVPECESYVFAGWSLAKTVDHIYDKDADLLSESPADLILSGAEVEEDTITFYAKWYKVEKIWMPVAGNRLNHSKDIIIASANEKEVNLLGYNTLYFYEITNIVTELKEAENYHLIQDGKIAEKPIKVGFLDDISVEPYLKYRWTKTEESYELLVEGQEILGLTCQENGQLTVGPAHMTWAFDQGRNGLYQGENINKKYLIFDGIWTTKDMWQEIDETITFYQEKVVANPDVEYPNK